MEIEKFGHIYFVGIGGIGMSALALYFHSIGTSVAGYDRTATDLTRKLSDLGMPIHYNDDIELIPEDFKSPDNTLVVYTPAIPGNHQELVFFRSSNFRVEKRAAVLGAITRSTFCFAVAGTHGKTTTSCIMAHLLNECDASFSAFLGGISENYDSNLLLKGSEISVVEADEFDRSFLNLSPDYACITSMDADHLDIYGDASSIEASFRDFANCIKPNGKLFVRKGLPISGISYGVEEEADYAALNVRIIDGSYHFDFKTPETIYEDLKFNLPGRHNLSNAIIALAMTAEYGFPQPQLAKALASFKGVKRRFTRQIDTQDLVFIDDYAHHPEEIKAVNRALREMYPEKTITAVFQPHLYSRTKDFGDEFGEALALFDEVVLLPIYPARELPIPGIDEQWLFNKIQLNQKQISTKQKLSQLFKSRKPEVLVTMGAGDISEEVKTLKKVLLDAH